MKDLHDGIKLTNYFAHHHSEYLNASTFYVMCNAGMYISYQSVFLLAIIYDFYV